MTTGALIAIVGVLAVGGVVLAFVRLHRTMTALHGRVAYLEREAKRTAGRLTRMEEMASFGYRP